MNEIDNELEQMSVNERIAYFTKKYRNDNNLTQKQLADLLFVEPQTISAWERGIKTPSSDSITNLITLFEISADLIYKYQNHAPSKSKRARNKVSNERKLSIKSN